MVINLQNQKRSGLRALQQFFGVLAIVLCVGQDVQASHISGVDIDYQCVGVDSFLVQVNLYRDCNGIGMPTTIDLTFQSTCGQSFNTTFDMGIPPGGTMVGGVEISQLCPLYLPQSTCNGGTLPGMERFIYSGIVVLSPACDHWNISWTDCCRNNSIVNLQNPGGADMFAETELYTVTDSCNNSPIFTAAPIPYVCVGQPVFFNYGAVDPDGDSLSYSLIPARSGPLQLVQYAQGYGPLQPIPGITLDPFTGAINFTPTMIGQFVIAVRVEEYDSNGNLKGMIMRDMQFAVINCPANSAPVPNANAQNVTGNITQIGPMSFLVCPGETLGFDIVFADQNNLDTIQVTTNAASVVPGITFSQTGTNPVTASFSWTAVPLPGISSASFIVVGEDTGCPTPGLNTATVFIQVADSVTAGPESAICPGDTTTLYATGGASYTWSAISGPPLVVGQNISCINCNFPQVFPTSTTSYLVSSNVNGQCINTDTVTVQVSPFFDIGNLSLTDVTCNGDDDAQFVADVIGTGGPPWYWQLSSSGTVLVDSTTTGTQWTMSNLTPGTYTLALGDSLGCVRDTTFDLLEPAPLTVSSSADTTICLSTPAVISASANGGNGGYTFNWTPTLNGAGPHSVSPTVTTNYSVQVTDALGCLSPMENTQVTVNPPLSLSIQFPDSVCPGDQVTIASNVSGGNGGPYSFVWSQPGLGQVGTGNSFTYTPAVGQTTTYLSVSDSCGTPTMADTAIVNWFPLPQPIFSVDTDTVCAPDLVVFDNLTDPSMVGNNCVWDFGDGSVVNNTCGAISHIYQSVGCYDVNLTVFSPQGCPNDTTFPQFVCAFPYPIATFDFSPEDADVTDPVVTFNDLSTNADSLHWTFGWGGNLGTSSDTMPIIVFPDDIGGDYPVSLWVTTDIGCTDSIIRVVTIDAPHEVWIPNAFTPDGDGKNELFYVSGIGISRDGFLLQIFNRWGELVFESFDPSIPWDGSNSIPGVYTYRCEVEDLFSTEKSRYFGHITLLR